MANLVDYLRIAACLAAWEALERGEYKIRCILEVEHRWHAIKVVGGGIGIGAVLHFYAPLAAPFSIDLDAEFDIQPFDRFLIHCNLHEDEHKWYQDTRCAFVQLCVLLAQAPLHVPGMDAIVHVMEGRIEKGR